MVITPKGLRYEYELAGEPVWTFKGFQKVQTIEVEELLTQYTTQCGSFVSRGGFFSNGQFTDNPTTIDAFQGPIPDVKRNPQDVMDGLVIGDGNFHKASKVMVLFIGDTDKDYFRSEIASKIIRYRPGIRRKAYEIETTIDHLPVTYERYVPDRFLKGNPSKVAGFLRGLFSANGSCLGASVTLRQTSVKLITQVQCMLSSIGIRSKLYIDRPRTKVHHNGIYTSKQAYTLSISPDRYIFFRNIGFIQQHKSKVTGNIKRQRVSGKVLEKKELGIKPHTKIISPYPYWLNGILTV